MRVQTQNIPTSWHYTRLCLLSLLLAIAFLPIAKLNADEVSAATVLVYKSPSCGCCGAWVDHMKRAGFSAVSQHPNNLSAIKDRLGVAPAFQACHTATTQGYVFEGHIPAETIQKFLVDKPSGAIGLVVPGMPMGSPGMDTNRSYPPYKVLQLNKDGSSTPYATVSMNNITYWEKKSENKKFQ